MSSLSAIYIELEMVKVMMLLGIELKNPQWVHQFITFVYSIKGDFQSDRRPKPKVKSLSIINNKMKSRSWVYSKKLIIQYLVQD